MSETPTETSGPTTAELAARQDKLDGKLDQILNILGTKEGAAQQTAQRGRETELDAPTTVAEEIRRQIEERDRAAAADKSASETAEWRKGVDAKLAGMAEQAPEPPVRRIEKLMGWR
jgi:hypothetical protein